MLSRGTLVLALAVAGSALVIPHFQHEKEFVSYSGYSVYRAVPQSEEQVLALQRLNGKLNFNFDFWKAPSKIGRAVDVLVPPPQRVAFIRYLTNAQLTPQLKIADVGKNVVADFAHIAKVTPFSAASDPDSFDFYSYHSFADIMSYIQAVAAKYPNFVTIGSIGESHQGRNVQYLKIGYPGSGTKNTLFIDGGIHAREWISPAMALWTIHQLTVNSTYTDLLKAIDVVIAPVVNPDGYEYSRNKDRMWRKNRSGPVRGCYGVDLNRNFPYKWMVAGASTDSCDETYAGASALSEMEAKNLANFINANKAVFKAYLTLHSYGEEILYPWGYATGAYPPDVNDLRALGKEMYDAIEAVHGTQYNVENSAGLYPASGASDDYSKSVGVKYVYTVELRPGDGDNDNDSWYGFDLPAKFIKPTVEETLPAILATAKRVQNGPF